ncbi:hypothetical protein HDV63DRAFT_196306 [Trichoderma sp. SZMC 28014]
MQHTHSHRLHRQGHEAPNRPTCTTNYPGPTRNASSGRGWVQAAVDNKRVLACTYPRPQLTPAWYSDNLETLALQLASGKPREAVRPCSLALIASFSFFLGFLFAFRYRQQQPGDGPPALSCFMALLLDASSDPYYY